MESIAQKIIYEIFFGDHKVSADLQVPDTVLMDAPYHAGLAFEAQEICCILHGKNIGIVCKHFPVKSSRLKFVHHP